MVINKNLLMVEIIIKKSFKIISVHENVIFMVCVTLRHFICGCLRWCLWCVYGYFIVYLGTLILDFLLLMDIVYLAVFCSYICNSKKRQHNKHLQHGVLGDMYFVVVKIMIYLLPGQRTP